jgi:hypothetical protein
MCTASQRDILQGEREEELLNPDDQRRTSHVENSTIFNIFLFNPSLIVVQVK